MSSSWNGINNYFYRELYSNVTGNEDKDKDNEPIFLLYNLLSGNCLSLKKKF